MLPSNLASTGSNTRGRLFVTVNGVREATTLFLDLGSSTYWPCVHLQKTNAEVVANFGSKPFAYQDGNRPGNGGLASTAPINRSTSGNPFRPSDGRPAILSGSFLPSAGFLILLPPLIVCNVQFCRFRGISLGLFEPTRP